MVRPFVVVRFYSWSLPRIKMGMADYLSRFRRLRAYDHAFNPARKSHPIEIERKLNMQSIDGIVSAHRRAWLHATGGQQIRSKEFTYRRKYANCAINKTNVVLNQLNTVLYKNKTINFSNLKTCLLPTRRKVRSKTFYYCKNVNSVWKDSFLTKIRDAGQEP